MSEDLENKLIEKYPIFFEYLKGYDGPIVPIQFGFECGDGWYHIIDTLMESISNYIEWNKKGMEIDLRQVKEKFGSLRFYIDGGDEYISGMISMASNLTYKTCEECGTTKNVGVTSGWIKVICEDCLNKESPDLKEKWKLIKK